MAPIGQIRTHGMNCSQQLDFKHLRNVPKFAEEDTTNQNIINKVNKATSELENKLNRKIDNLRLDKMVAGLVYCTCSLFARGRDVMRNSLLLLP